MIPLAVHAGDCVAVMATMEPCSVDAIVTDPPYGIGFMGREFDTLGDGPRQQAWHERWAREALRVLKPGGHCLAFGGTRTFHRLACALEDAGFEIRDSIGTPSLLAWIQGQGFSKVGLLSLVLERQLCHKVKGKTVYRDDGTPMRAKPPFRHPDADGVWGLGGSLKPSWEPIVVARRPLAGTVAANVQRFGTGAINVGACRVKLLDGETTETVNRGATISGGMFGSGKAVIPKELTGRFPANVVLSHLPECRCVGVRRVRSGGDRGSSFTSRSGLMDVTDERRPTAGTGHADADGMETVEAWECADECAVAALDAQSGALHGPGSYERRTERGGGGLFNVLPGARPVVDDGQGGGASRFFYCAKADGGERWFYCRVCKIAGPKSLADRHQHGEAKARKASTNMPDDTIRRCAEHDTAIPSGSNSYTCGCPIRYTKPEEEAGEGNRRRASIVWHPTVKPVDLMRWLVRLVTPPKGLVLDPFAGTGTTGVACIAEGFRFVGVERDPEYLAIAKARLSDGPLFGRAP